MLARLLLVAIVTLVAPLSVSAQGLFGTSEPADRLIGDALATPYAEAMLTRLTARVRKSADPACLQAKALDDAALIARGRALLQRRGEQMLRILDESLDRAAFRAALAENGEPDAMAEMERLGQEPDVKAFLALYRPARLATVLDSMMEQFDRYVLVGRIKLDAVSPGAYGEPGLPENPTEAAEAATQKYLDEHPSQNLERYLDLQDAVEAARPKGFKPEAARKSGPMQFFAGADGDLAEVCIGKR
jgi:hypothetical protein